MKTIYKLFTKRTLLLILTIHLSLIGFSVTYYVSNSGNDTYDGKSPEKPWKTLVKVNAVTFVAGDQILFQRGSNFYGTLTIKNSGTSGNSIIYGAYGTGANPIITGFTTVIEWTNLGGNIWESTNAVSTLSTCNMVVVNEINVAMGRFPNADDANSGYLIFQTHSSNTSITSNSLEGNTNWLGAEIFLRNNWSTFHRSVITSQSGGQLTFNSLPRWDLIDGYGFFIQNDIRTLDQKNEWYYNPTTKKINIYNTSEPIDVKIASIDNLININANYVIIENITINGANKYSIFNQWYGHKYITIQNVDISFSGIDAISIKSSNSKIENSNISDSNSNGITLLDGSKGAIVRNNSVKNSGVLLGMNSLTPAPHKNIGIYCDQVTNYTAEYNKIINSGYNGLSFYGDSATIRNNFVDRFCLLLQDGGGIYTWGDANRKKMLIEGNIVINGIGNVDGTNSSFLHASGIYLDDNSINLELKNNTISSCSAFGVFFHNCKNIKLYGNTLYDNGDSQFCSWDDPAGGYIENNLIENNLFISKSTVQQSAKYSSSVDANSTSIVNIGIFNNNYYARPIDDDKSITISTTKSSLNDWQIFSGQDANSHKSPQAITDETDLQFEYNATTTAKTVALSIPMIDIKGAKYAYNVTLQPFTSVVLMKDANPVEVVVPVYVSSVIENDAPTLLEITYNTNLDNVVPATSAFSVKVNSVAGIVNSVSISGTKVMLTLASPLFYGDVVSVDYTKPSVNPIQTVSEGLAVSVSAQSVINNVALLKQGSIPPTHFIPVWNGENGLNHMNIMVVSADLEDLPLLPDDEIAVFSGSKCVGSMKLSKTISSDDNSTFLTIPASQDDGSGNGFTINDTIVFKIWDNKNQQEMIAKAVVYKNNLSTWLTTGKYVAGATSVVEIVSYIEYSQTIQLKKGYNMISTFISAQNPMACHVTQSLADAGYLTKLQDEAGNSLEDWGSFGGWVNNIGNLEKTEGYKIKVTDNCSLLVTGRPIALPLDIPLKSGWNIISFPRTDLVNAMNIIQPLIDQNKLVKVQDEAGNSIENWGIFGGWKNCIGYFTPGKAYKVKMTSDAVLTIQENYLKSAVLLASIEQTEYFLTEVEGNGSEHVNINIVGIGKAGIVAGWIFRRC